nr:hypothetical protein [Tanacetum cinerariifolium]
MLKNQKNVKSRSDKGYHALHPPYTGNYMPPKPDLMFIDEQVEIEYVDVVSNVASSDAKSVVSKHGSVDVKIRVCTTQSKLKLLGRTALVLQSLRIGIMMMKVSMPALKTGDNCLQHSRTLRLNCFTPGNAFLLAISEMFGLMVIRKYRYAPKDIVFAMSVLTSLLDVIVPDRSFMEEAQKVGFDKFQEHARNLVGQNAQLVTTSCIDDALMDVTSLPILGHMTCLNKQSCLTDVECTSRLVGNFNLRI